MSRAVSPNVMVGNEFVLQKPKLRVAEPAPVQKIPRIPVAPVPIIAVATPTESVVVRNDNTTTSSGDSIFRTVFEFMHKYSLGAFALLFLLVASSGIQVASIYWAAHVGPTPIVKSTPHAPAIPTKGPNIAVASTALATTMASITNQPLGLTIGSKNVPFAPETINSWLKPVIDKKTGVAYVHADEAAIKASLLAATGPYVYGPVDQVTTTHEDGSTHVIVNGRNGTTLADTSSLANQITSGVLSAKGMQLNIPLQTVPFNALTAANFDKLIEVDVVTKRMYTYEKGQLVRTYLISAGAPETPTPLGQFKIRAKLPVQDMRGFNPNGTKYFQPHVQWISYFSGGNAIHGNYWRPTSWFGNINSSHGCVSLPNDLAKIVYDWAPIGTTIINHS